MAKRISVITLVVISVLSIICSCTVTHRFTRLKNCTNDTLYIGVSKYDNFDSIRYFMVPLSQPDSAALNYNDYLWKKNNFRIDPIFPDSICERLDNDMFRGCLFNDTGYIFVIQKQVATYKTLEEISKEKLYDKVSVAKVKSNQTLLVKYHGRKEKPEFVVTDYPGIFENIVVFLYTIVFELDAL